MARKMRFLSGDAAVQRPSVYAGVGEPHSRGAVSLGERRDAKPWDGRIEEGVTGIQLTVHHVDLFFERHPVEESFGASVSIGLLLGLAGCSWRLSAPRC